MVDSGQAGQETLIAFPIQCRAEAMKIMKTEKASFGSFPKVLGFLGFMTCIKARRVSTPVISTGIQMATPV